MFKKQGVLVGRDKLLKEPAKMQMVKNPIYLYLYLNPMSLQMSKYKYLLVLQVLVWVKIGKSILVSEYIQRQMCTSIYTFQHRKVQAPAFSHGKEGIDINYRGETGAQQYKENCPRETEGSPVNVQEHTERHDAVLRLGICFSDSLASQLLKKKETKRKLLRSKICDP